LTTDLGATFTALGAAAAWVVLVTGRFCAAVFDGVCAILCMP
jgi:hypothetical protein